jgi:hypothetical protein
MMIEVSTAIDGDNFFPALCRLIGKMFCERFVPPGGIEEAVKVKKFHPPSNHLGFFCSHFLPRFLACCCL